MKSFRLLLLLTLALFLLPAGASASVMSANGVRDDSAFTKVGQVYAEGTAGLGKYVWYVDQTEDEAILRGYDQDDPTNLAQLAVVNGTYGVGLGRIGAVGGIAYLPGSNRLLVLDRAKDRLVSYPRSNDGSADDPVDYEHARTRSHSDDDHDWFDLKDPNGLAVDPSGSGRIYIADTGHRRILELGGSFHWFRQLTQPWWGPATRPGAMTVDSRTGRVFVSIEGGARIEIFKRDLAGSEPSLSAPSSGDFVALSAEPNSNRLFAAKKNEIDVFSLSTGTLLGSVGGFPFNNQIAGISAVEGLRHFHLASLGPDHAQSYFSFPPPVCTAPSAPLEVAVGESVTFTPDCDDTDHSTLKEFSIENSPAHGTAKLVNDRGAIEYTAEDTAAGDVVKYKVMTQDGLSALGEYPINVVPPPVDAPTVVISAPASGDEVGSPVTASFTLGGGAADAVTCQWDSEPATTPCTSPQGPKTLSAGAHSFTVSASNVGGNASATSNFEVVAEPVVSIDTPTEDEELGSPVTAEFTLGGDPATTVECQWDDEPAVSPCTSPQGPRELDPGDHSFTVTASNIGGSDSETRNFAVVEPPAVVIIAPSNVQVVGSPATATFSLGGGTPDTVSCQWDNEPVITPCSSPQGPKTLTPGIHTFTVTAINAAEAVSVTSSFSIASSVQAAAAAVPVVRQSTNLKLESGDVFIKVPGSDEFVKLTKDLLIPIGTLIDSTDGRAHLTLANADKSFYDGIFWGGVFEVKQGKGDKPFATMKLRPGFGVKGKSAVGDGARVSALKGGAEVQASRRRGKKKGGLWGDGKGNFRTSGSGGTATVRGTRWYVADYENGSLFRVDRGIVNVRPIHGNCFDLKAGETKFVEYKPRGERTIQKNSKSKKGCF